MSAPTLSHGARLTTTPSSALPPVLASTVDSALPTCVIVIGMAGSGKTTLMQRMLTHCTGANVPHYSINLDPGVSKLPYTPNIDIRDTVNYKQVQSQYGLGPNGAILTSLNLFATRFDQVMSLASRRALSLRYIFIDTPGQIEIFSWSASGVIISEALSCHFPTVVLYVIDTPRCQSPVSFMSNMLYACSIMYKSGLPFLVAFNKCDIVSDAYVKEWMTDYDSFVAALSSHSASTDDSGGYMTSLTKSMSLVLDEFYRVITVTGVSAVTGVGTADLFHAIDQKRREFYQSFVRSLEKRMAKKKRQEEKRIEVHRQKLKKDREGEIVMDMKKKRLDHDDSDEQWATGDGDASDSDGVDEASDQDDEFEDRLAQQREKSEFDDFMQKIKTQQQQSRAAATAAHSHSLASSLHSLTAGATIREVPEAEGDEDERKS